MNPVRFTLTTAAAAPALLVASTTPVSGTPLTLTGSQPDVPRRIAVVAGSEAAQRTLTITGTNRFGSPISEVITVPATTAGTYSTVQDFATVTQALPGGGGWSVAATVGTTAVASSPWFMREWGQLGRMGVLIYIPVVGPTCQLEVTWDDIEAGTGLAPGGTTAPYPYGSSIEPQSQIPPLAVIAPATNTLWTPLTGVSIATGWVGIAGGAAGGAAGEFDVPVTAVRMTQTAGSGSSTLYFIETTADRTNAF